MSLGSQPFAGRVPVLMAIVGAKGARSGGEAVRAGADLVQLRAKELSGREMTAAAREVIRDVGGSDRVLLSSRPDIAELLDCLGVHLPESGLDLVAVRREFPRLVVGVSRHDREGLLRAEGEGADYVLLGPAFPSPGKEERALGIERWRKMVQGVTCPVLAVGGVTPANARAILDVGGSGVAAIRPFLSFESSGAAVRAFRMSFKSPSQSDLS